MTPVIIQNTIPKTVFHYTTAAGLLGILNTRQIWLSDINFLNDSKEMLYAARAVADDFEDLLFRNIAAGADHELNPFILNQDIVTILYDLHTRFGLAPSNRLQTCFELFELPIKWRGACRCRHPKYSERIGYKQTERIGYKQK